MPSITVGNLAFHFPNQWSVAKFDDWSFVRNQFQSVCGGAKAVDILAINSTACFWKIEVKDYRQHQRTKSIRLPDEVALKVRDSLAALVAAKMNANDPGEKAMATAALKCSCVRVVLHLEQPAKHSKLFPRAFNPANVQQRLRQLVRAIDPHASVHEIGQLRGAAWTVT
jgi:hypothetical protein